MNLFYFGQPPEIWSGPWNQIILMLSKATGLLLFIIWSGFSLYQGEELIARELVGLACTQKSRIQNCTNQGPRPGLLHERSKSSQNSEWFLSGSIGWAKSLLLISEHHLSKSRSACLQGSFLCPWGGWPRNLLRGRWRRKGSGNPLCEAGYNFFWLFFFPLGKGEQLALHYWLPVFLFNALSVFFPQPSGNHKNQMNHCSCTA